MPRYQCRLCEVNEAVVATYLAGGNTRRLRGALAPLLKAAPLSKSVVSRVERKAPKHALAELRADFHRIVYGERLAPARGAFTAFERKWHYLCPGVVRSLQVGGEELLTLFQFPKSQWKTLRTTNVIERLHEEFRRRVKTQSSLPTEDPALVGTLPPRL